MCVYTRVLCSLKDNLTGDLKFRANASTVCVDFFTLLCLQDTSIFGDNILCRGSRAVIALILCSLNLGLLPESYFCCLDHV